MELSICLLHSKPLGTPKEEHEFALYHCYRPVLTYLYANRHIKLSMALSGPIFDWIEHTYPEINMLISDLVKRGQLELLTGGFYDPPFPLIPIKDRGLQIEKMNTFLRRRFGKKPAGAVSAEQLWQSSMVTTLNSSDIEYVILYDPDEEQFAKRHNKWYEPYIMVDVGRRITILPASSRISAMIPSKESHAVAGAVDLAFRETESSRMCLLIHADDMVSSFMLKDPGSMVEYLDDLFTHLKQYNVSLILPRNAVRSAVKTRGYLQSGWYHRSRITGIPADFHEVLSTYPEAYHVYCRIYYLQKLILGIKKDKSRRKSADQELMKAQSSHYFWPGSTGGIYRNLLRKEQNRHLIEAEKITRERGVFVTSLNVCDFDYDGLDEYVYRGKHITALIDTKGGSIRELDYLISSWNYIDTFTGSSTDQCLVSENPYRTHVHQGCFTDLFFTEPQAKIAAKYDEQLCANFEYVPYITSTYDDDMKSLAFSCDCALPFTKEPAELSLEKSYRFKSNSIEAYYVLENTGETSVSCCFTCEMNLSFGYEGPDFVDIHSIDSTSVKRLDTDERMANVRYLMIHDLVNGTHIGIYAKNRFLILTDHYSTTIRTQYGEEDIYQHTVFRPFWQVQLEPGEQWTNTIGLRIEKRKTNRRIIE